MTLTASFLPHLHTFLHTPSSSSFATYLSPPSSSLPTRPPLFFVFHTICFQISKISAFNCPPTCSLAATFCHATSFLLTHRALLSLLFTDGTTRGRYVLIAVCCLCVAPPPAVNLNGLQHGTESINFLAGSGYKDSCVGDSSRLRPYPGEHTVSRPICEVKHLWAGTVLRCESTREAPVS